jgi:hypothetical protein
MSNFRIIIISCQHTRLDRRLDRHCEICICLLWINCCSLICVCSLSLPSFMAHAHMLLIKCMCLLSLVSILSLPLMRMSFHFYTVPRNVFTRKWLFLLRCKCINLYHPAFESQSSHWQPELFSFLNAHACTCTGLCLPFCPWRVTFNGTQETCSADKVKIKWVFDFSAVFWYNHTRMYTWSYHICKELCAVIQNGGCRIWGICVIDMALAQKAVLSLSCISDAIFMSFKQNLVQVNCSFKSAITKLWITHLTHNSKHPLRSSRDGYGCKTYQTDS